MNLRGLLSAEALVRRAVQEVSWKELADFVSPSFFEVVPARSLWKQGRELVSNARDPKRFRTLAEATGRRLEERGVDVELRTGGAPGRSGSLEDLDDGARRERGQRVLEIYFGQLLSGDAAVLDLRPDRFAGEGTRLVWSPSPFFLHWEPDFLDAVRRLYGGFYGDDDDAFAEALSDLGIEVAADLFRAHFGEGDQRSVEFHPKTFRSSFHEIFVRCRDAGVSLHPNFIALGFYLAALYDHLGLLGGRYDVRAAFEVVAEPGRP